MGEGKGGNEIEIKLADMLTLRAAASDATMERFLPVSGDELAKMRRALVQASTKRVKKMAKLGNFEGLSPLDEALMRNALGNLFHREVDRTVNRLEVQSMIQEALAGQQPRAELPSGAAQSVAEDE